MSHRRQPTIVSERLSEHPAVKAWVAATTTRAVVPASLLVMRERRVGAVYSLPGVADGNTVFAKRSRIERISVEQAVYEHILPRLPLQTPRYHGAVVNDLYGWIFVSDVGGDRYRENEPEHQTLAARWLATMHAAAVDIPAVRSLPPAGPERYLRHLHAGRGRVLRTLRATPFPQSEAATLNAIVAQCRAIEENWPRVEALCDGVPHTLVHCDFQPKNVFMTRQGANLSLWLIDWEMAGYGPPAADLTRIDLDTYWSSIRGAWRHVTFEAIERLARAGRVLQWVAAIDWLSASLECTEPRDRSDAVVQLQIAHQQLTAAARAAGITE